MKREDANRNTDEREENPKPEHRRDRPAPINADSNIDRKKKS